MKHLPKEKKQQLLLVIIGTVGALVGLWFGLINWQQGRIAKLASQRDAARTKLNGMTETMDHADQIQKDLENETSKLQDAEQQMASGDLYAWIINTVRNFKSGHPAVDIPSFSTIQVGPTSILPKFPYDQVTLTIAGRATYHDLGRFIADFENRFEYIRLQNLVLEPSPTMEGGFRLSFRLDIVALVKPEA